MRTTLQPLRTAWRWRLFALALGAPLAGGFIGSAHAENAKLTAPPPIDVRGDVPKPGPLRLAELEAMTPATFTWVAHGQSHTAFGVPLATVLRRFGWEPGVMGKTMAPAEKRVGYKRVIVATAPDGFQAVFSAAEIAPGMGKTQAVLAWMVDGKPLPAEQGPLRLVVLTDDEPSRSIYHLQRLDIVDMRRIVPVAAGAAPASPSPAAVPAGAH